MSLPYKPASLIHVKRPWCHYHYKLSTNSCFISVTVIRGRLAWIFGEVVVSREREVLTTLTHSSPQIAPPSAGWGPGEKWKAGDACWWHDDPVMFDKIPQTFIGIKDKDQALFRTTLHWAGSFLSNTFLLVDLYEFIACKMCVKNAGYNFQQKNVDTFIIFVLIVLILILIFIFKEWDMDQLARRAIPLRQMGWREIWSAQQHTTGCWWW